MRIGTGHKYQKEQSIITITGIEMNVNEETGDIFAGVYFVRDDEEHITTPQSFVAQINPKWGWERIE